MYTYEDLESTYEEEKRLHDLATPFLNMAPTPDAPEVLAWRNHWSNAMHPILEYASKQGRSWWKGRKPKANTFLLTFTRDPKTTRPVAQWEDATIKQLKKTWFTKVKYVFEHKDTNIHCHAYVQADRHIHQSNFKMYMREFGHVDIKIVGEDNGIEEYMSKENPIITLK